MLLGLVTLPTTTTLSLPSNLAEVLEVQKVIAEKVKQRYQEGLQEIARIRKTPKEAQKREAELQQTLDSRTEQLNRILNEMEEKAAVVVQGAKDEWVVAMQRMEEGYQLVY